MSFNYQKKIYNNFNRITLIKNSFFNDKRGILFSQYSDDLIKKEIKKKFTSFQDKIMFRKKNSLTGIHGDKKSWKLLSCLSGEILVVLVECNKKSKNFGKYIKILLKGLDKKVLIIPPLIGNSYLCLKNKNIISYKILFNGKYYDYDEQFTYKWNDPHFKIKWPVKNPILSKRDK